MSEILYKGVPFLSNIDSNIIAELDTRAIIRNKPFTPFVKVVPGFIKQGTSVDQCPVLKGILDTKDGTESWKYSMSQLYRQDNYYRPLAGITSLEVEFRNVTGAIRKAALKWVCHSLDDFEKLAPYFLNPGKSLLLEWGWSQYNNGTPNGVGGGSQFTDSTDRYSDWSVRTDRSIIKKNIIDSRGNYDAMIGVIVNFDMQMKPDGGFECTTHVVSQGDLSSGFEMANQYNSTPSDDRGDVIFTLRSFVDEYLESSLANDFEKGKINENISLLNESQDSYIVKAASDSNKNPIFMSWGYIEENIINTYCNFTVNGSPSFKYYSTNSRIRAHKDLRTTDLDICIIPITNTAKIPEFSIYENGILVGKPRRILINSEFFKQVVLESKTLEDCIGTLLSKISDACGSYWKLRVQKFEVGNEDVSDTSPLCLQRIVDLNHSGEELSKYKKDNNIYTFRIKSFTPSGTNKKSTSIIKNISFSLNLSKDAQLQVFYASNSKKSDEQIGNERVLHSLWNFPGEDRFLGVTSISPITDSNIKELINTESAEFEEARKSVESFNKLVFENNSEYSPIFKKFLPVHKPPIYTYSPSGIKDSATTIKKGREIMRMSIFNNNNTPELAANMEALVPINLEIELEGISGINPGDVFFIDNMPTIYRDKGVFQVVNISHSISKNAWMTKLKAHFRIQNINQ